MTTTTTTARPGGFRRAVWGCYGIEDCDGTRVLCWDYEGHFELPLRDVLTHEKISKCEFREEEDRRLGLRFEDSLRFWAEDLAKMKR